jgi:hypothetical protein
LREDERHHGGLELSIRSMHRPDNRAAVRGGEELGTAS